jgi:hypothetical protein
MRLKKVKLIIFLLVQSLFLQITFAQNSVVTIESPEINISTGKKINIEMKPACGFVMVIELILLRLLVQLTYITLLNTNGESHC